jgi:hypothetical protein
MRRIAIGELLEVTCEGKQPRLTVAAADGAKSIFLITDPDRVEMKNADGITHEFTCGPQKNTRVKVGYAAAPADSEIKGLVRSIDVIK